MCSERTQWHTKRTSYKTKICYNNGLHNNIYCELLLHFFSSMVGCFTCMLVEEATRNCSESEAGSQRICLQQISLPRCRPHRSPSFWGVGHYCGHGLLFQRSTPLPHCQCGRVLGRNFHLPHWIGREQLLHVNHAMRSYNLLIGKLRTLLQQGEMPISSSSQRLAVCFSSTRCSMPSWRELLPQMETACSLENERQLVTCLCKPRFYGGCVLIRAPQMVYLLLSCWRQWGISGRRKVPRWRIQTWQIQRSRRSHWTCQQCHGAVYHSGGRRLT